MLIIIVLQLISLNKLINLFFVDLMASHFNTTALCLISIAIFQLDKSLKKTRCKNHEKNLFRWYKRATSRIFIYLQT